MADPFRYTLRFSSDPTWQPERDKAALARFVKAARIDDVAMFLAAQDLNTGHLSPQEQEVYLACFAGIKQLLAPLGVTLSVNQWYSVMHEYLGHPFTPQQGFTPMVDRYGNSAPGCACPADERWQEYFCDSYARAARLEPEILWVEDDFRWHNHPPLEWGGCFCDAHMEIYSAKAGRRLTRQQFVKGVLAPGEPHPYRAIWLDTCREVQEAVAVKLGRAVRRVSATAKVGLMSSVPYIHAAEGRRWKPLLEGFAAGNAPVDRIHLPGYVETTAAEYMKGFNMVAMQTRHFLPAETEVYPELENYPYGLFTKSLRFTRFQLLACLPLAVQGIAMNLFDLNGNGIREDEGFEALLAGVKDYLNACNRGGVFHTPPQGVQVMCGEGAAYTLHTSAGKSMEELYPQEVFWAGLLPAMGIPFAYCSDPAVQGCVVAISGQYLRGLTRQGVEALFAGNYVLLNGDALEVLCGLGLGHLAGAEGFGWMRMNSGEYTYEQSEEGGRASAVIFCSDAARVRYRGEHRVLSRLYNARRQAVCPAVVETAGRVLVFPFGRFATPQQLPPMLLNRVRQQLLQGALARAARRGAAPALPIVADAPHVIPYYYRQGGRQYLYLVNASGDARETLVLHLSKPPSGRGIYAQHSTGECGWLPFAYEAGILRLNCPLAALETVLLCWE